MKILKLIIPFAVLAIIIFMVSCSNKEIVGATPTQGPVVLGKKEKSTDQVWIPYSFEDDNPTLATQKWVMENEPTPYFKSPVLIEYAKDLTRLSVMKYSEGAGHVDAPTKIEDAQYIFVGGREYGSQSYRLIGFGYRYDAKRSAPVIVGMQEKNTNDDTFGDFIVGTRDTTKGTPTIKLRVTNDGYIRAKDNYAPLENSDLAPKSYVDKNMLTTGKPTNPVIGQSYYNKDGKIPEFYDGKDWRDAAGNIKN